MKYRSLDKKFNNFGKIFSFCNLKEFIDNFSIELDQRWNTKDFYELVQILLVFR